eukprot:TRINITY_DN2100_c0_g1_i1.p1 TRINITY_DN2100_c0_g1~~TRINITY_DN2100_c0_g1_i1.p1  ORF type:complete len:350 (+),score=129.52 TRINITY_DN2100_c0_g1_i1:62-1111(+)
MEEEPQSSELALLAASESEFFRKLIDTVPPSVYYRESSREGALARGSKYEEDGPTYGLNGRRMKKDKNLKRKGPKTDPQEAKTVSQIAMEAMESSDDDDVESELSTPSKKNTKSPTSSTSSNKDQNSDLTEEKKKSIVEKTREVLRNVTRKKKVDLRTELKFAQKRNQKLLGLSGEERALAEKKFDKNKAKLEKQGVKVFHSVEKLKKAVKRQEKKKEKSVKAWASRTAEVEEAKQAKTERRANNIKFFRGANRSKNAEKLEKIKKDASKEKKEKAKQIQKQVREKRRQKEMDGSTKAKPFHKRGGDKPKETKGKGQRGNLNKGPKVKGGSSKKGFGGLKPKGFKGGRK